MTDVALHTYTNNNTLSSAWWITLLEVPRVGDRLIFNEEEWFVVRVYHNPADNCFRLHHPDSGCTRPTASVWVRPIWAPQAARFLEPGEKADPPEVGSEGGDD